MCFVCNGLCLRFKFRPLTDGEIYAKKVLGLAKDKNSGIYSRGLKWCSVCCVKLDTEGNRCLCCGVKLRTKYRESEKRVKVYI